MHNITKCNTINYCNIKHIRKSCTLAQSAERFNHFEKGIRLRCNLRENSLSSLSGIDNMHSFIYAHILKKPKTGSVLKSLCAIMEKLYINYL